MKKKYQVFLSSTYLDLQDERRVVMEALLEMDLIPCGMELFPSADEDQWSLIKKVIDECDYYVVIVAGRYGSIGDDGKSYTQMEYEYALSKGKPIIAFLHRNPESLPNNKCEGTVEAKGKLSEFRKLCQNKMCKAWSNSESLAGLIHTSLYKLIATKPAIGWIRADQHTPTSPITSNIRADDFFYTLDERPASSFPELIKGARSVSILARTAVNLLSQYERTFDEMHKNGCHVRLLFISPSSEAAQYVYGSEPNIFSENIRKTNVYLSRITKTMGNQIKSKTIKHAPTMGLILVEKVVKENSLIIVQLYFLHSRVSRDRPLFRLNPEDKWFSAYAEEFEELWRRGDDVSINI